MPIMLPIIIGIIVGYFAQHRRHRVDATPPVAPGARLN
jgi:hypothetical protein